MTPARARLCVDIFTGAVIVSVALALANLTWRLQGYTGVGPAAAPVAPGGGPETDIRPLLALAPFGTAVSSTADAGDGSVQLRAIFMAVPAEASIVLVAASDGKVVSYGVGQALGGGTIESIQPEQIIVRTSAGQRVIGFNPIAAGTSGAAPGVPTASAAAAAAGFAPVASASPSGAAAIRAMIPQSVLGAPAPAPATSPIVGAVPAASGYRIGASPNPALAAAGLRSGDTVLKVNGAAVNAGSNERDLMASAMASGNARLEVLRDGQKIILTVPVR